MLNFILNFVNKIYYVKYFRLTNLYNDLSTISIILQFQSQLALYLFYK